jgi:hypothetical protein
MINIAKVTKPSSSGTPIEMDRDGQVGVQSLLLAPTGISYHPKNSDLVISLPVEGNAGNSFSISVERGDIKLALKEGEIAVGHFGGNAYFVFRADGTIEGFGNITHTGNMVINGDLTVTGKTTLASTTTTDLQSSAITSQSAVVNGISFSSHVHRANLEGELTNVPE